MAVDAQLRSVLDAIETHDGYRLGSGTLRQDRAAIQLMVEGQEQAPEPHRVVDFEVPGAGGPLPARGYWPSDDPDLPVVLFWHGGGWQMGGIDSVDRPIRALVDRARVAVISTTHRLAPEHPFPAALDDAYAVLTWLAENSDALGARRDRVIVAGESSGGNIAAAVARRARDAGGPAIAHQFLITPALDAELTRPSHIAYGEGHLLTTQMMALTWRRYLGPGLSAHLDSGAYDQIPDLAAPLRAPDLTGLPPATMIVCECDPLHDEGVAYAARLEQAGVVVRLARFPGLTHGALNFAGVVPAAADYARAVAELLAQAAGTAIEQSQGSAHHRQPGGSNGRS